MGIRGAHQFLRFFSAPGLAYTLKQTHALWPGRVSNFVIFLPWGLAVRKLRFPLFIV